jgi:hypothetical protein
MSLRRQGLKTDLQPKRDRAINKFTQADEINTLLTHRLHKL